MSVRQKRSTYGDTCKNMFEQGDNSETHWSSLTGGVAGV